MRSKSIFFAHDRAGWALEDEASHAMEMAKNLGHQSLDKRPVLGGNLYFIDRYLFLGAKINPSLLHKVAMNYYHGLPSTSDKFGQLLKDLESRGQRLKAIRVTNNSMESLLRNTSLSDKVLKIPIEVDTSYFQAVTPTMRLASREQLGISPEKLVFGSFQKDGIGWGGGLVPKMEKGPDLLRDFAVLSKRSLRNAHFLLLGPSRGWITNELKKEGVSFSHFDLSDKTEVASAYHALDFYCVTSRDEGGPKSALEALASGIPVISTPVGQPNDMESNGQGLLISEDVSADSLFGLVLQLVEADEWRANRDAAVELSQRYSVGSHEALWRGLFERLTN